MYIYCMYTEHVFSQLRTFRNTTVADAQPHITTAVMLR
jgi:hypothetical protein